MIQNIHADRASSLTARRKQPLRICPECQQRRLFDGTYCSTLCEFEAWEKTKAPPKPRVRRKPTLPVQWAGVNWGQTTAAIAQQMECAPHSAQRMRWRLAPETVKPRKNHKMTKETAKVLETSCGQDMEVCDAK